MSAGTEQRKLAAIMFTDMVGYSALAQRNEALALELLEEHRSLLRGLFPNHQGREVKTTGDGFLVEFASALAAVRCAIEIQRLLATRNVASGTDRQLQVRIGIHVGDVVHHEGDVLGDGVNIASRIEPLAGPGGICISVDVERQIRNAIETSLVKLGPTELKNIQVPMELFRIVLPWEKQEPSSVERGAAERGERRRRPLVLATIVFFILASISCWIFLKRDGPTSRAARPSRIEWLAVLPLKNYSGDTNQDFFVDGMADILNGELSQISGLQVKSHTTAMQYKGSKKSVPEIAKELNVDAIVEGSVQRDDNHMVISVQLIEAATDRHLWSHRYEREIKQVLKTQAEVVEAIAKAVQVTLTPQEASKLATAHPVNPAALDEYLKGQQHWYRFTRDGFDQALKANLRAISIDPSYAPAYAGVGACYTAMANNEFVPPKDGFVKAREMINKAMALEQSHRAVLGDAGLKVFFEGDWAGARKSFNRALELKPNDGLTHQLFSFYLIGQSEFDGAMFHARRAVEMEPMVPIVNVSVARVLYYSRKYDESVRSFQKVVDSFPLFPWALSGLGFAHLQNGQPDEAIKVFERALRSERLPRYLGGLGAALAKAGRRSEAEKVAQELTDLYERGSQGREGYASPLHLATVYAALGEKQQALDWLGRGVEEHAPSMYLLKVDPAFENLKAEKGFGELLRKLNLE